MMHFKEKGEKRMVVTTEKGMSHAEKMSKEAKSLGLGVHSSQSASETQTGSVVAKMLSAKPAANPYKKMMETPSEMKQILCLIELRKQECEITWRSTKASIGGQPRLSK